MNATETWRPVVGYEGLYAVSSEGRVMSMVRYPDGRILGVGCNPRGYRHVVLRRNGIERTADIHRLVAEAFCTKPDGCDIVNHLNSTPGDDRACNLEWTTTKGNSAHAKSAGRLRRAFKLNTAQRAEIAALRSLPTAERPSARQIAARFGVCRKTVVRAALAA